MVYTKLTDQWLETIYCTYALARISSFSNQYMFHMGKQNVRGVTSGLWITFQNHQSSGRLTSSLVQIDKYVQFLLVSIFQITQLLVTWHKCYSALKVYLLSLSFQHFRCPSYIHNASKIILLSRTELSQIWPSIGHVFLLKTQAYV